MIELTRLSNTAKIPGNTSGAARPGCADSANTGVIEHHQHTGVEGRRCQSAMWRWSIAFLYCLLVPLRLVLPAVRRFHPYCHLLVMIR